MESLKEAIERVGLHLPDELLQNRTNGERRKTKRAEFWYFKYYRFPRRLVFDTRFWNRFWAARAILPIFGVHCSGIPKRKSYYLGHRLLSRLSGVTRGEIGDALRSLTNHYYPLVNFIKSGSGSRPNQYGLNRNATAKWEKDTFFPFYGWYLYSGKWAQLSSAAKDLYLVAGAVSYQDPGIKGAALLNRAHLRLANYIDVEEAIDVAELVFNKGKKNPEYLDLENIFLELESQKMLRVSESQIEIALMDENLVDW